MSRMTLTTATVTPLSRRMLPAVIAILIPLATGIAQTPPFSVTITPGMDTVSIQRAIDNSTSNGTVYFRPGTYNLTQPLHLRGGRTYMGAGNGNPRSGTVLVQTAPRDPKTGLGTPVFSVDEALTFSVTITGFIFDSAPGMDARGIAAGSPATLLALSTIRNNSFRTGLSECVDVPMILTWIMDNEFGVQGPWIATNHRHIRSVYPADAPWPEEQTNANWVIKNDFRNARGSESVLFEAGLQLHLVANKFKDNDADKTLQINGMLQVVLRRNRFDGNRGDYIMHFANSRHSGLPDRNGNYLVRSADNYYDMQRCDGCPVYSKYIFHIDMNMDNGYLSRTHVYMGNESGRHFLHTDGTRSDLTDPAAAAACNGSAGIYLSITGPFSFEDYTGTQTGGCR